MAPLGIFVGFVIAAILFAVAGYFGWLQRRTLQMLRVDTALAKDQRRYLFKQCWRRLFGSWLLLIVAGLLVGALFLDYDPPADAEAAREPVRFLIAYVAALLLFVLLVLVVALFDFWATARYAVDQRKQLIEEHQALLKADLARHLRHRADMN